VCAALIDKDGAFFYHLSIDKELKLGQLQADKRIVDGLMADGAAFTLLGYALGATRPMGVDTIPQSELMDIIYENPLFLPNGNRPQDWKAIVNNDYAAMVPTSGNPPHVGHYGMAKETGMVYGDPVFAVTADSVHKPSLSAQELLRRVAYFRSGNVPVVLTRGDPLFIDKARQFPGKAFAIGTDTLERMLDPKWSTQPIADMLAEFWDLETSFMVFNRDGVAAQPLLDQHLGRASFQLGRGRNYQHLFQLSHQTWDISSSQLRAEARIVIPDADFDRLVEKLETPPAPTPALKALARQHSTTQE
jgi:nicotinic acid mononucleotide adenylyltransferase